MKCFAFVCVVLALIYSAFGFTQDEINLFISKHNEYRDKVGTDFPDDAPATCINHVVWDNEVAQSAQNFVNSCPTTHDRTSLNNCIAAGSCGENLAWSTRLSDAVSQSVNMWYEEYADYSYTTNGAKTQGAVVGHYTQLVWNKTLRVGCGVNYNCNNKLGSRTHFTLSCRYYPPGNYGGQRPWVAKQSGQAAAVCPAPAPSGSTSTPASSSKTPTPASSSKTPTPASSGKTPTPGSLVDTALNIKPVVFVIAIAMIFSFIF